MRGGGVKKGFDDLLRWLTVEWGRGKHSFVVVYPKLQCYYDPSALAFVPLFPFVNHKLEIYDEE